MRNRTKAQAKEYVTKSRSEAYDLYYVCTLSLLSSFLIGALDGVIVNVQLLENADVAGCPSEKVLRLLMGQQNGLGGKSAQEILSRLISKLNVAY